MKVYNYNLIDPVRFEGGYLKPITEFETLSSVSTRTLEFRRGDFLFALNALEEFEKLIHKTINDSYTKLILI